jgi:hypothetical protein
VYANDNNPEDVAGTRVARRLAIRPLVGELLNEASKVDFVDVPKADISKAKGQHETEPCAIGGDVRFGFALDEEGKRHKVVVQLGKLRFSDGTQTEKARTMGPDGKLLEYDRKMPVGAILGGKEAEERMLGGDGLTPSNRCYTAVYGARFSKPVKRVGRVPDQKLSKAQMKAELEAAIANTPAMPAVKKMRAGFPWKPAKLRELFLGLEKTATGNSGSIGWVDVYRSERDRAVWAETVAALSEEDRGVLDALRHAKTMADLSPDGQRKGKAAQRRGKAALLAANDNLAAAYKKSAA